MSSLLAGLATSPEPLAPLVTAAAGSLLGDAPSRVFFGVVTGPDLLRLLAVPVFAWAAFRDVETRRVPNRTWAPLLVAGVLALAWDAWLLGDVGAYGRRLFAVRTVLSAGLVAPLGYLFWRLGGFGGADAKAVITLAVLLPVYPTFYLDTGSYPAHQATLGLFSLTVLSNTVLVGLVYPLVLALRNLPRGEFTPAMFVGRPVDVEDVTAEYGRLLESPDGFTRRGLDVDALRMYLRWRGVTLEALRADPDRYRHPLPTERNDPGDGSIAADERALTDGGTAVADARAADSDPNADAPRPAVRPLDAWGVERFLSEHDAYGTTPRELRGGLEVLTEPDRETVWLTPGIPFLLPMFVGLVVALAYGDVLFALLSALGAA